MDEATLKTSLFEIFKIGIGPSSSHTVGPMRAASEFVAELGHRGLILQVSRIQVDLYGSLALTGKGHATDRAVILGLCGDHPETVDIPSIESRLATIRELKALPLRGVHGVHFDEARDLLWHKEETLKKHSNGMRFSAFDATGKKLAESVYYSIGGGFIVREGEERLPGEVRRGAGFLLENPAIRNVPHPFSSAAELLDIGERLRMPIWQIVLENEKSSRSEEQVRAYVEKIWQTMRECVIGGLQTEGILPGGLKVRRRAPGLTKKLEKEGERRQKAGQNDDPLNALDWVNVFAMAVNEENASGGRMVTAPTNGAAGVIPAVAHYYERFVPGAATGKGAGNGDLSDGLFRFFLTAAAIGILYKENASISGAEVGCQGEVGVACSMAAGGLVAALGGTNQQVEYAAEIGMEHNLGMTCDPIGGLVQIPCIERNAMGAVKAINACRIAMHESGEHKISLDQIIETMYRTGLDMQSRYKETSLGGLATLNIIEC
jgi:L-serine dehydratase